MVILFLCYGWNINGFICCYYTISIEETIIKVVNLKGDSYLVGDVVGQFVGVYYGSTIPNIKN